MIKNSIRKIVVVTCLLFLKKKPYHRDIASLFFCCSITPNCSQLDLQTGFVEYPI